MFHLLNTGLPPDLLVIDQLQGRFRFRDSLNKNGNPSDTVQKMAGIMPIDSGNIT